MAPRKMMRTLLPKRARQAVKELGQSATETERNSEDAVDGGREGI